MFFSRLRQYSKIAHSLSLSNRRLLRGVWKFEKTKKPLISFFGGGQIEQNSIHAVKARQLAKKCAQGGFAVVTGGGPGIMEAANKGAQEGGRQPEKKWRGASLAVGLDKLNTENLNPYVDDLLVMDHFFARKWLLTRHSAGFVVFPGGFGTMDELYEVLTLLRTKRIPQKPVILVGKDFWTGFYSLITEKMLQERVINKGDEHFITTITDDIDEVYQILLDKAF